MKCGSPIRCATERASRTAWAEQHDASASLAASRHSSSVTATASRPARATSSAATAESTPPLIATSVRARDRAPRRPATPRDRGAERDVQRVGGQLGGVELARREPAQLGGDLPRADPRGVEHARAAHQLDRRRARRDRRAAARGLEARVDDAVAVEREVDRTRSPQAAPPALPENDSGGA